MRNQIVVTDQEKAQFNYELRNYHRIGPASVAKALQSDLDAGLTSELASINQARFGANELKPPRDWPLPAKFVFAMFSGFAPLLWIASLLCFIAWQPLGAPNPSVYNLALAILLLVIIFLGGIFVFWQEYQTSRVIDGFRNMIPARAVVVRDGASLALAATQLTMGDVVILETGMKVPADVRIVGANNLRVDNSMLTGESEPVRLAVDAMHADVNALQSRNMGFMGATVMEGTGRGIVVAVGAECQIGRIAAMSTGSTQLSALQKELNIFVLIVGGFALFFFTLVLIVWGAWINVQNPGFMSTSTALANAIGVVVAFVPEGLPLALAAALTIIAKRLCDQHKMLLKQLPTVETLGSMSMLASDKTGTLTQNRMTVVNVVLGPNADVLPVAACADVAADSHALMRLAADAALCNEASIQAAPALADAGIPVDEEQVKVGEVSMSHATIAPAPAEQAPTIVGGNGTDKALLAWAATLGGAEARVTHFQKLAIPFSSATKQAISVQLDTSSGIATVIVKGAPDGVLPRCTSVYDDAGEAQLLTPDVSARLVAACNMLGKQGQRVLAICERVLPADTFPPGFAFSSDPLNFPIDALTLAGLIAVADPPRESTAPAVLALRGAGVSVVMVTGDAETTAEAIARQVGIVTAPVAEHVPADLIKSNAPAAAAPSATPRVHLTDALAPLQQQMVVMASPAKSNPSQIEVLTPTVASVTTAAVVSGHELARFTPEAWKWLLQHDEIVLARTTPEQKLAFVKAAQNFSMHRVGVTGDGINDAPALKNADVGIAMNSGADAARDAAHVVLLTDDFSAMVHGVREGRLLFANLRKISAYLITGGCWAELIPVLANFFVGMPQPLSAFLMIYISCLTDVCAAIALIAEAPEGAIMRGKPRDHRTTKLVDLQLVLSQYLVWGMVISFATFFNFLDFMLYRGPVQPSIDVDNSNGAVFGYSPSQLVLAWTWGSTSDQINAINAGSSVFFVTIVVCQLGNYMNVRRRMSPYMSDLQGVTWCEKALNALWYMVPTLPMLFTFVFEIGFALLVTETPALQAVFLTASVPARQWGIAFGFSFLLFAMSEAGKWIVFFHPSSVLRHIYWT